MNRRRSIAIGRLILAFLATICLTQVTGHGQASHPRRIAGFGSSVAFGTGDESGKEGYTGVLRGILAPKGWEVFNQSRPGDTTKTAATRWTPGPTPDPKVRYLTPVNPGYVWIGLSMANEGIAEAGTPQEKDAVYQQYADGIKGFVTKAREQNIVPVVGLGYPRSVYTSVDYEYVRRMNILQNSWDVPSVNFLGAADDGTGRWARGFMYNDKHPNTSGHREFALAFVPTLFDALEAGKPLPVKAASQGFARVSDAVAPLGFAPDSTMHSFAVSMMVRSQGDGTVAAVSGSTLAARIESKKDGNVEFEEAALTIDRPVTTLVAVQNGKWSYKGSSGTSVASTVPADAQWHHIVLSHYMARGETLFFVDGKLAGSVPERLEPNRFVIGGPGVASNGNAPKQADYKDVFIFRSALNADEVAVLNQGKMLQASLEVYAPLGDAQFRPDSSVENRAQSLAKLNVGQGKIVHVAEQPGKAAPRVSQLGNR